MAYLKAILELTMAILQSITIYEAHTDQRQPPQNITSADQNLFAHEYNKAINATTLLQLTNACIFSETLFTLFPFRYYLTYSLKEPVPKKVLLKNLLRLRKKGKTITSGIWIVDTWSTGYFHWLTDALPRLMAASARAQNSPVLLPHYYQDYPYIAESLKFLNIPFHYYNIYEPYLKVKTLWLPSHTAECGNYNKTIINHLRNKFLASYTATPHRKIYISRLKAHKRKINNEAEVVAVMEQWGYEVHYFEDYSFARQVGLMAETKTLISLHGAGLTNMLFMPAGGQVMELRNRGEAHLNCFYSLASDLGHAYYYLQNKGDSTDTNTANITVDIQELQTNLQLMQAPVATV